MTTGRTLAENYFFEFWGRPEAPNTLWHSAHRCADQACVIHNPTSHHMRSWNMNMRPDRLILRSCPHNQYHPDPDSSAGMSRILPHQNWTDHDCDGCCRPATGTHALW